MAVDLDFPLVEYDLREPVAIIEHKRGLGLPVSMNDPSLEALGKLGQPLYLVRYDAAPGELPRFRVTAWNELGKRRLYEIGLDQINDQTVTEIQYVELLHKLRGLDTSSIGYERRLAWLQATPVGMEAL